MDKILQILQMPYQCEETAMRSFRIGLMSAIRNGQLEAFEKQLDKPITGKVHAMRDDTSSVNVVDAWELDDVDIPENSIALIAIEGMIYPWRTYRLEEMIRNANANPKILGICLFVNTPGGYVLRVDIASELIKNSPKPIAVYRTGMCCSAGEYLTSGAKRIFSASPTDVHGSIGTMTTFSDDSKFWEMNGFVDRDIYATLSTKKNYENREASKDPANDQPIIDSLDFHNKLFHETISKNRSIPFDSENEVFQGAVFFTQDAIDRKLVDEIGTLETALNWVLAEGLKVKANNMNY